MKYLQERVLKIFLRFPYSIAAAIIAALAHCWLRNWHTHTHTCAVSEIGILDIKLCKSTLCFVGLKIT